MAKIGLKHVVGAVLNDSGAAPAYANGRVLGKAISAELSVEIAESVLYADDSVAETIKEFKNAKLSLNTDDLTYEVQGMLLGHTVTANTLTANSNDNAPYVGVGFMGQVMRGGITKYRAIWLGKVKFGEPADSSKTKGENIEFGTPTIEGTVLKLPNGDWKTETTVDTETAALAWLDAKAGITGGGEL